MRYTISDATLCIKCFGCFFFFFQAEDGIRDLIVTGVQTFALPIWSAPLHAGARVLDLQGRWLLPGFVDAHSHVRDLASARRAVQFGTTTVRVMGEIGRASCRERV